MMWEGPAHGVFKLWTWVGKNACGEMPCKWCWVLRTSVDKNACGEVCMVIGIKKVWVMMWGAAARGVRCYNLCG